MSSNLTQINLEDKRVIVMALEDELKRVKSTTPPDRLETATRYYKTQLVKTLQKLNPRGYYS